MSCYCIKSYIIEFDLFLFLLVFFFFFLPDLFIYLGESKWGQEIEGEGQKIFFVHKDKSNKQK